MTQIRRNPGISARATSTTPIAVSDSSLYRRQDGYTAPSIDDRLDAQVIEAANARGFRIAARCTRCRQWVVAAESVAAHMGPVCRAKAGA
ncbi:hypothetical protein Mycch_2201 [Mycolicibacterium chubuense NBB4]|uniref:Uncharacterized protein n=1 Tax=Mycolicibacterium chubuense (strain NBB4) TaxID=710421 RepID=I4BI77_MYCCN|nr:hypothetical protein [Mycolicibacterium chubuense]AFM16984.1 hypothetical protein Mycch_2201 [Mycolicibacterium chubuense NBB4]